jgi:hypothetical protein
VGGIGEEERRIIMKRINPGNYTLPGLILKEFK